MFKENTPGVGRNDTIFLLKEHVFRLHNWAMIVTAVKFSCSAIKQSEPATKPFVHQVIIEKYDFNANFYNRFSLSIADYEDQCA